MTSKRQPAVSHDGDIVRVDGRPLRMEFMVRDAFWAGDRAVVLLDPNSFLDEPGGARRAPRDAVHNLRAYAPSGELLWEAEQPEKDDHYYMIEKRAPLVALSFSAYRCDLDPATGHIRKKTRLK
jgi:hypothetical protein